MEVGGQTHKEALALVFLLICYLGSALGHATDLDQVKFVQVVSLEKQNDVRLNLVLNGRTGLVRLQYDLKLTLLVIFC